MPRGTGWPGLCMFDMVFNHTSTEHAWFRKPLPEIRSIWILYISGRGAGRAAYQLGVQVRRERYGNTPHLKKWYLHLFDVTQADLNWDNPKVREELKNVIRFWKNKGVKGFRFDVVNLISKPDVFVDDDKGDGRRFYTDGPRYMSISGSWCGIRA